MKHLGYWFCRTKIENSCLYKRTIINAKDMRHEKNRIQSKVDNIGKYILNKIYWYTYHIFKNLFVKHAKNNFVKYKQITLTFSINETAILSAAFFLDVKI